MKKIKGKLFRGKKRLKDIEIAGHFESGGKDYFNIPLPFTAEIGDRIECKSKVGKYKNVFILDLPSRSPKFQLHGHWYAVRSLTTAEMIDVLAEE